MHIPPSAHFTPLSLAAVFNARRADLPKPLKAPDAALYGYGAQSFIGIPFALGEADGNNVLLLDHASVAIDLAGLRASYLIFVHVVGDRLGAGPGRFGPVEPGGNELGGLVSDYQLEYADGTTVTVPIKRRFAIQQSRLRWGASPFEAVPAVGPEAYISADEAQGLGRVPARQWGGGETRTTSGRDRVGEHLWLYALPNPQLDKPLQRLVLTPREEPSVIYALAYTQMAPHPLRPGVREKLMLQLPAGAQLNALGELDDVSLDLGTVISARRAVRYDRAQWLGLAPDAQPVPAPDQVLIEYAAHALARLYVGGPPGSTVFDLAQPHDAITPVRAAHRPVRLRVVERGSNRPVPVRLHLHGAAGEYLPPRGHHRKVNGEWFEDIYAEFVNDGNQYSYIPGECVADLPLGEVFVELTRGYEVAPLRSSLQVKPDSDEITLELDRPLRWRDAGWVTADTHVHFLSPQTALLEGAAEGVNVVNLLASQWGEMFSNVGDFDGRTTLGAKEFGGDGEFLVRVGTENRMQVLGHISLLGYDGRMIDPLCTGGPSESALGDPQQVAMAEWARQCLEQNGLVVMPHAPDPQCERAADIVLGLVQGIELMSFNPFMWQIRPEALLDWYRYLNLGYQLPVVGGSDKMGAAWLLGGIRTYAHLGDQPFSYESWKQAVRAGNTFVTVGPLVEISVEGQAPGQTVRLPAGGGTLNVTWKVETVRCPADSIEFIVGGQVAEVVSLTAGPEGVSRSAGSVALKVDATTWIAARVRGSVRARPDDVAAHTSAVQVIVGGRPQWSPTDAAQVLAQIEGALAYVDTLAPSADPDRLRQIRAVLASAHELMHQRAHALGGHGAPHSHQHGTPH